MHLIKTSDGVWDNISMIPIVAVDKDTDRKFEGTAAPTWSHLENYTATTDGHWVCAFPVYPNSDKDYPIISIQTRLGQSTEIIISPIDLNGAKIRKLPIARTLEFEFTKNEQGTTDGLEHHILLSTHFWITCPPSLQGFAR